MSKSINMAPLRGSVFVHGAVFRRLAPGGYGHGKPPAFREFKHGDYTKKASVPLPPLGFTAMAVEIVDGRLEYRSDTLLFNAGKEILMAEKTQELIQVIRTIACILHPYVDASRGRQSHPYILFWWGNMLTVAGLIEYQKVPITEEQKRYLLKEFLGGMGSFNDFSLNQEDVQKDAEEVNNRLREAKARLYRLLQ